MSTVTGRFAMVEFGAEYPVVTAIGKDDRILFETCTRRGECWVVRCNTNDGVCTDVASDRSARFRHLSEKHGRDVELLSSPEGDGDAIVVSLGTYAEYAEICLGRQKGWGSGRDDVDTSLINEADIPEMIKSIKDDDVRNTTAWLCGDPATPVQCRCGHTVPLSDVQFLEHRGWGEGTSCSECWNAPAVVPPTALNAVQVQAMRRAIIAAGGLIVPMLRQSPLSEWPNDTPKTGPLYIPESEAAERLAQFALRRFAAELHEVDPQGLEFIVAGYGTHWLEAAANAGEPEPRGEWQSGVGRVAVHSADGEVGAGEAAIIRSYPGGAHELLIVAIMGEGILIRRSWLSRLNVWNESSELEFESTLSDDGRPRRRSHRPS